MLHLDLEVVLQVAADLGQIGCDCNAVRPQMVGRPDAGQHQELRRVHRPAREDDLACRDELLSPAGARNPNSDATAPVELQARHEGAGAHLEIAPAERGPR